jgi:hypothetical protein
MLGNLQHRQEQPAGTNVGTINVGSAERLYVVYAESDYEAPILRVPPHSAVVSSDILQSEIEARHASTRI